MRVRHEELCSLCRESYAFEFFPKRRGLHFLCGSYKVLIFTNSGHEHEKSRGGGQEVESKSALLQAKKKKAVGCKWPLERRCGVVKRNCTITGLYCGKCERRSKGRESANSESVPSGIDKDGAAEGSDFAGKSGKVKREQNLFNPVCRGELHLIMCDWKQFLELEHLAKD